MSPAGDLILNLRFKWSRKIRSLPVIFSPVPLRSPITLGTRCTRCGFSSLWHVSEAVLDYGDWRQTIAPQDLQKSSPLVLSFCMFHWPQAGHRGSPRTFEAPLRGALGLRFFGTAHPFLGRLTLGTIAPSRALLKSLTEVSC